MSSPEVEREKKDLVRLSITVKTNLKVPNFLDIHFGIKENICQPYKKPNDEPLYINKNSNHLPMVIKHTQGYVKTNI